MKTKEDIIALFQIKGYENTKFPQISQWFYREFTDGGLYIDAYIKKMKEDVKKDPLTSEQEKVYKENLREHRKTAFQNMYLLLIMETTLKYGEKAAYKIFLELSENNPYQKEVPKDYMAQCALYAKTFLNRLAPENAKDFIYDAMYHEITAKQEHLRELLKLYTNKDTIDKTVYEKLLVLSILDISNPSISREDAINTANPLQNFFEIGYMKQFGGLFTKIFLSLHCMEATKYLRDSGEHLDDNQKRAALEEKKYCEEEIHHVVKNFDLLIQSLPKERADETYTDL